MPECKGGGKSLDDSNLPLALPVEGKEWAN